MLNIFRFKLVRRLKWLALGVFGFALAAVSSILLAGAFLTVDSGIHQANAIVVLGGDPGERTIKAIEIYDRVQPCWVVISGSCHESRLRSMMVEYGIPDGKILSEDKSTSTFENATNAAALLRELGTNDVVVVTSWFHSRRALATFRHVAPELRCYSVPAHRATDSRIWPAADEWQTILTEYSKILYYWAIHGVSPWM
jgi:uncharacterized SAM-binding protein YcdF (DUF218 family)